MSSAIYFLRNLTLLLLATLATCSSFHAQDYKFASSIDSILNIWSGLEKPGITIAIVRNGKLIYENNVGMANIGKNRPNDSTTTFWIASTSKQFTAAGIYLLANNNKLSLQKSVRTYLTDLPLLFNDVTIDHLVHHTSGIRDGFVLTALSKKPEALYTNENVLAYLKQQRDFSFRPGSAFEYNNSGYVLLARVIEKVSGVPYPEFMKVNFFQPLGMLHTYISGSFPATEQMAEGYKEQSDKNPSSYAETHFKGNTYGSTGVITTIKDLVTWSTVIQSGGVGTPFQKIISQLLTSGKLDNGKAVAYGGGLEKVNYKGKTAYEHFGADEGFKANMIYFPEQNITVIGLTNNGSQYKLQEILYGIADLVLGITTPHSIPLEQPDEELLLTTHYYDPVSPKFLIVNDYKSFAKIGTSANGYAAPFGKSGQTLVSGDPLPVKYRVSPEKLKAQDQSQLELTRIIPDTSTGDLNRFLGEYYSDELQTSYKITNSDKGIAFELLPGVTLDLYRITPTDFMFEYLGPNYLQFDGNAFFFSREGCRRLRFERK
ncbi:MAG: serine hydrolase domain-containing protein [Chitinophagaceae bacterium]